MKKYIYLLVVFFNVLACNDDNDRSSNVEPTLNGSWSLINVLGGLTGIDDDYEANVIIWNFDQENQELTVINTNVELVIYDGLPTGVYDYQVITTTGEDATLIINNFSFNLSLLTESSFILNEGAFTSDGFQLTFCR